MRITKKDLEKRIDELHIQLGHKEATIFQLKEIISILKSATASGVVASMIRGMERMSEAMAHTIGDLKGIGRLR